MNVREDKIRILCLDDEVEVVEGLRQSLHGQFDVTTATSGSEALSIMLANEPFVAVISDMKMPEMDGAEFFQRVRMMSPNSIRILLTGHADLDSAIRAVNQGYIFRFLTKPCEPEALRQAVSHAVDQYRLHTAEERLLNDKLLLMADRLVRAEQLATLGTLARGAGHELADIATTFCCHLPLIEEQARRDQVPELAELEDLRRASERLRLHGHQLMNLGRPSNDGGEADLKQVVEESLALLRTAGKINLVKVDVDLPAADIYVAADESKLEQVLVNLIGNAADALVEGRSSNKVVSVRVRAKRDGLVRCELSDKGPGMSANVQQQAFEPYFSTKPPQEGTGLGLTVAKQIVESFGGTLTLRSAPGRGTQVAFELPWVKHPISRQAA